MSNIEIWQPGPKSTLLVFNPDVFFSSKQPRKIFGALFQICSYWMFSKGLEDEFETVVVNEPSVFEPLKFY